MSDYSIGSLATLLVDLHKTRGVVLPDLWFRNIKTEYREYIKSPEWKRRSQKAKERANYRCQKCGKSKRLEAHHKTYARLGHELPTDIVVLCRECHQYEHTS